MHKTFTLSLASLARVRRLFGRRNLPAATDAAVPADAGAADTTPAASSTYHQHVAPILQAKCVTCHAPGGIAPFALDTPAAAQTYAGLIKAATQRGDMPPWPPGPRGPAMLHERRLSSTELALLAAWADARRAAGRSRQSRAAPASPRWWTSARRTSPSTSASTTSPDPALTDDYRCFLVDPAMAEGRMITGYRITPGNRKIVHHVITSLFAASDRAALQALDAQTPGARRLALRRRAGAHRQRPAGRRLTGLVGARRVVGAAARGHRHGHARRRPGRGAGALQPARRERSRPHPHRGEAGPAGHRGAAAAAGHHPPGPPQPAAAGEPDQHRPGERLPRPHLDAGPLLPRRRGPPGGGGRPHAHAGHADHPGTPERPGHDGAAGHPPLALPLAGVVPAGPAHRPARRRRAVHPLRLRQHRRAPDPRGRARRR